MKYIDAEILIAEIDRLGDVLNDTICQRDALGPDWVNGGKKMLKEIRSTVESLQQEQPEVDYNIIPLPEERMASYIAYCLGREDDDGNCPTCGKYVTGLRLFPYYYDRENNDVYFASVCPECGKIIISKE